MIRRRFLVVLSVLPAAAMPQEGVARQRDPDDHMDDCNTGRFKTDEAEFARTWCVGCIYKHCSRSQAHQR